TKVDVSDERQGEPKGENPTQGSTWTFQLLAASNDEHSQQAHPANEHTQLNKRDRRNPIIKEEARQIPIETKQQRGRRYHQIANQAIGSASPLTTQEIAPPHRLQKRLFLCSRPQCGHFIS